MVVCSCGSINVPNEEACIRLTLGASCAYTISGKQRDISEAEWLSMSLGRISMTAASYTNFRRFIEESCARHKDCHIPEKSRLKYKKHLSGGNNANR